jgi:hypothetical protein
MCIYKLEMHHFTIINCLIAINAELVRMETPDRIPAAVQTEEHSDWMQGQVQAATNSDSAHSSSVT